MNRTRIGGPGARSQRPVARGTLAGPVKPGHRPGHGRSRGPRVPEAGRDMMAWADRYLWLVVRTVIRAVQLAHHEQVRMWECILETSGEAPLTAAGPLRWVRSLDGYRLEGNQVPAQDPAETGR